MYDFYQPEGRKSSFCLEEASGQGKLWSSVVLAVWKTFWDFLHFLTFSLSPLLTPVTNKIPWKMQQSSLGLVLAKIKWDQYIKNGILVFY